MNYHARRIDLDVINFYEDMLFQFIDNNLFYKGI